jgi:hypothetical protein
MATTLPLLPLLDRAYRIRREYLTEVITNRDGSEQRRSLRQTPRKVIEFDTTIRDDRRLAFDRLMTSALRSELAHPELPRYATTSAAITASGHHGHGRRRAVLADRRRDRVPARRRHAGAGDGRQHRRHHNHLHRSHRRRLAGGHDPSSRARRAARGGDADVSALPGARRRGRYL